MFRRTIVTASLAFAVAAPLTAQMTHDRDVKVEGAGILPKGWLGRTDNATSRIEDAKFVTMGSGFHVTSGPAAIYWNDKSVTSGPFTASVTIRQTKNPAHPEAYGIFFQGRNLDKADQNYAYLLVRGDGKFLLNHRAGTDVHKIIPWTENAAVHKADASGVATNTVMVDATKPDSVRFLVNGTQVAAVGTAHLGSTDGVVGLRVNHNLDVHLSDFVITPAK